MSETPELDLHALGHNETSQDLQMALLPGLHVICGTRSPSVSGILLEKMLCILRINLTRPWLSTRIFLGVVSLATHTTEILASQILCGTTTTTEGWNLNV